MSRAEHTQQSDAPANRPQEAIARISRIMHTYTPQIARLLPQHLNPERILEIAALQIRMSASLQECSDGSLMACIIESSRLGLELGGPIGEAYLVPFRDNANGGRRVCQLVVGYRGFVQLGYRSPLVSDIGAALVYEGDDFDWRQGSDQFLHHKPCGEDRPEKITHAYAEFRTRRGGYRFHVMTRTQLEKAKQLSPQGRLGKGPWIDFFDSMCLKTPMRRLWKWLPMARELGYASTLDEAAETGRPQMLQSEAAMLLTAIDVDGKETEPSKLDKAKEALRDAEAAAGTKPTSTPIEPEKPKPTPKPKEEPKREEKQPEPEAQDDEPPEPGSFDDQDYVPPDDQPAEPEPEPQPSKHRYELAPTIAEEHANGLITDEEMEMLRDYPPATQQQMFGMVKKARQQAAANQKKKTK